MFRSCPTAAGSGHRVALRKIRISETGTAEPPQTTSRNDEMSCPGSFSRRCMTSFQMVGTAPATVGRCVSIMSITEAGSRWQSGNTKSAPAISAAYGIPHALAWNIGTIGSTLSLDPRRHRVAPTRRHGVQVSSNDGCRQHLSGGRWCRWCSTSRPPSSRRCGASRTRPARVDHLGVAQHGLARVLQRRKVALPHRDHRVHGVEAAAGSARASSASDSVDHD